jgi:hypothetical protein
MNSKAWSNKLGGASRLAASWFGICGAAVVLAAPVASGATSARLISAASPQAACDAALSPAAVSAIVGYTVPKDTASTVDIPPKALNHNISATGTACEFSAGPTLADLKTTILVTKEVTSKPLTAAGLQAGLKAVKGSTVTFAAYGALGGHAYYYSETLPGAITVYGMTLLNGTTETAAALYTATPQATLASLVKLGEKI